MTHRLIPILLIANWLLFTVWLNIGRFSIAEASVIILETNETLPDRLAAFGARIPDEGFEGNLFPLSLLHPSKKHGCEAVSPPADIRDWVALVERGECTFVEKVRKMQASGAVAVAVGDPDSNRPVTMYAPGDTSDVLIPSIFLAQQQYARVLELFKELGKKPEPIPVQLIDDGFEWPLLDLIIIVVLSPTVMMVFVYTLWRIRAQQRRKKDLAPVQVVDKLPTKIFYKEKRKENEPEECVICLEDFVDEDELRVLPCRHEFHIPCIDSWLTTRKKLCPICKRDVCPSDPEAAIPPTEQTPLLSGNNSAPLPVVSAPVQPNTSSSPAVASSSS